jgi:hypothetical protein
LRSFRVAKLQGKKKQGPCQAATSLIFLSSLKITAAHDDPMGITLLAFLFRDGTDERVRDVTSEILSGGSIDL